MNARSSRLDNRSDPECADFDHQEIPEQFRMQQGNLPGIFHIKIGSMFQCDRVDRMVFAGNDNGRFLLCTVTGKMKPVIIDRSQTQNRNCDFLRPGKFRNQVSQTAFGALNRNYVCRTQTGINQKPAIPRSGQDIRSPVHESTFRLQPSGKKIIKRTVLPQMFLRLPGTAIGSAGQSDNGFPGIPGIVKPSHEPGRQAAAEKYVPPRTAERGFVSKTQRRSPKIASDCNFPVSRSW